MDIYRIMIVDDENDVRTVLRLTFGEKYEVVEANDGLDALEKLDRTEPDFVVLDVIMPLMDGFDTCRAIRNHPGYRDVPVLFLSVFTDSQSRKTGYGAGANLYLAKPFDSKEILSTVDFFLEKSNTPPRPKRLTIEELRQLEERMVKGIVLPAQASDSSAPADARPVPRVMIVSDQAAVEQSIHAALVTEFDLISARNATEAIDRIIMQKPDFIILDGALPGRTALDLCTLLRRNPFYAATPVLLLAVKTSEREAEYAKQLGVNDFLPQPVDPAEIRNRILNYTLAPGFTVRPKGLTEIHYPNPHHETPTEAAPEQ